MRSQRKLSLNRESLGVLDAAQLRRIQGGNSMLPCLIAIEHTYQVDCLNDISFEQCPQPITLPIEHCI